MTPHHLIKVQCMKTQSLTFSPRLALAILMTKFNHNSCSKNDFINVKKLIGKKFQAKFESVHEEFEKIMSILPVTLMPWIMIS